MPIKLHSGQINFLRGNPKARFRAALAGTQGGKTFIVCLAIARHIQLTKDGHFMVVAPNYKMLALSTKPTLEKFLKGWIIKRDEKIENCWYLINGSRVFLRSADNPDTLRGATLDGVCLDEASLMPKLVWDIAIQRTAVKQGKIYIATTPRGNNWLFQEVYKRREDPAYHVVKWTSRENPAFDDVEFERIRATSDPRWFAQEYEAEFVGFGGLVFPEWDYTTFVSDSLEVDPKLPIYWGVDFGISNPTFVSYFQVIPEGDGIVCVVDEYWAQGMPLPNAIEGALERCLRMPEFAACDPSGRARDLIAGIGAIDVLKQYGIPVRYKKDWNIAKQRMMAINEMHKLLRTKSLKIASRCIRIINAFEGYSYTENNDMPVKDGITDHPMESMFYFLLARPRFTYANTNQPAFIPADPYTGF